MSGIEAGTLADVVVTAAGDVRHVVASTAGGDRELEPGPVSWSGTSTSVRPSEVTI
jgi:hypothetical protein